MTSITRERRFVLASWTLAAALLPAIAGAQTASTQTTSPAQTPPTSAPASPRPDRTPPKATVDPTRPTSDSGTLYLQREIERSRQREIDRSRWNWRPIVRIGQDYTLRSDDTVRDITVVSGNVRLDGHVFDHVVVVFGDVHLGSTAVVERDVVVIAGKVTVDSGATVGNDLVVVAGTVDAPSTFFPRGDHIVIGLPELGEQLRNVVPWFTRGLLWGRPIVPSLGWVWMVVLIFFSISLALSFLFDRAARACATVITERPLNALLAGLLTLVLLGPIFVIMAATVVGILIIPFFACAVAVAWMLGKVGVMRSIGGAVVHQSDPDSRGQGTRSFVIGFALLTLAYMVPVVGIIAWAMVGAFGLGAGTMTFLSALRRESPKKVTPPPAGPSTPEPWSPPPTPPMPPAPDVYAPSAPLAFQGTEPTGHAPPMSEPSAHTPAADTAAAPERRPYATFLDRVAAFALDCLLVAIANNVLDFARAGGPFFLLLLVYHIAFWAWMGTTMGGIVVGVRIVKTTGENLRVADALVRGLGAIFSLAALCIGCLWMLQDPERQMWHDKIAGTYVVKVPRNALLEGGARSA